MELVPSSASCSRLELRTDPCHSGSIKGEISTRLTIISDPLHDHVASPRAPNTKVPSIIVLLIYGTSHAKDHGSKTRMSLALMDSSS